MKDYLNYKGKVCVVTGAASGMGKATTEVLVDLGAEVYAMDVVEDATPGVKAFIKVNLGEKDSIDNAFKQLPSEIDKFFGIAGISGLKQDFNLTATVNFIANKYMTEEYLMNRVKPGGAIAYMISNGGLRWEKPEILAEIKEIVENKGGWDGAINVLNALGLAGTPGPRGYAFSKRAMCYYVATIVPVFAEKNIRVNAVMPGATQSGLIGDFAKMQGGMDAMVQKSTGYAHRLAESREMAEPIVYLNSDMATYVSGELFNVDYGSNISMIAGFIPDPFQNKLLSR